MPALLAQLHVITRPLTEHLGVLVAARVLAIVLADD